MYLKYWLQGGRPSFFKNSFWRIPTTIWSFFFLSFFSSSTAMRSLYWILSAAVLSLMQIIRAQCTRGGVFCGSSIGCESFSFPCSRDLSVWQIVVAPMAVPHTFFFMLTCYFSFLLFLCHGYFHTQKQQTDGNADFLYDCAAVGATPQFKADCRTSASGRCRVVSVSLTLF